MNSLFSRAMEYHVEAQFRKDPSGRLVFLPFGPRKQGYFVDSKPDEEKIRSFLKMYRSASAMINLLIFPSVYLPGFVLNFCGMPLRSKLGTIAGTSLFFMLLFGSLIFVLWAVYKETVPGLTSSLSEVPPDLKGQLSEISPRPRRLQRAARLLLLVATVLLVLGVWAGWHHFRW
jgi:hypothetical protein